MTDQEVLSIGQSVIQAEASGLRSLGDCLSESFIQAVRLLQRVKGRVVISGMGKSGHIARKIASTFSSIGTPSLFIHPAEASHGDLGMIARDDALVMLSYSGETEELLNLVLYAKQQNVPLIAITHQARSALACSSTTCLVLPKVEEACPMGLAPTTSTTMMVALGDALAIALLKCKGFSAYEYKVLHPGGSLGRQLLQVKDLMHVGESLPLISQETPMKEALMEMTRKAFGCVGLLNDGGSLVGIITDGDLRRHISSNFLDCLAKDIMTKNPYTILPQVFAIEATEFMQEKKITSLFVMQDGQKAPMGILHIHDILRAKII